MGYSCCPLSACPWSQVGFVALLRAGVDHAAVQCSTVVRIMSQLGDFVSVEKELNPSERFQERFLVPTPPSDADLTLFLSAESSSHPSASPLPPWPEGFTGLQLRGAIPSASLLRTVQPGQECIRENSIFASSPRPLALAPPPLSPLTLASLLPHQPPLIWPPMRPALLKGKVLRPATGRTPHGARRLRLTLVAPSPLELCLARRRRRSWHPSPPHAAPNTWYAAA